MNSGLTPFGGSLWALFPAVAAAAGGITLLYDYTVTAAGGEDSPRLPSSGSFAQTHLALVLEARVRSTQVGTARDGVNARYNGYSSGLHYEYQSLTIDGPTVTGAGQTGNNVHELGQCPSAGAGSNRFGIILAFYPFYAVTSYFKHVISLNYTNYDVGDASTFAEYVAGTWVRTATEAITAITISHNGGLTGQNSRFRVWGIGTA